MLCLRWQCWRARPLCSVLRCSVRLEPAHLRSCPAGLTHSSHPSIYSATPICFERGRMYEYFLLRQAQDCFETSDKAYFSPLQPRTTHPLLVARDPFSSFADQPCLQATVCRIFSAEHERGISCREACFIRPTYKDRKEGQHSQPMVRVEKNVQHNPIVTV